jgi:hypothetical protein
MRGILLMVILMLAISMLTGCPPQVPPPGDSLTAKELWDIMKPFGETLGDDVVPLYIEGREYSGPAPEPYPKIHEGKAYLWKAGLYSAEEKTVWLSSYLSHRVVDGVAPEPGLTGISYSADSLTVTDLADWNIDSPEACEIATQNGAGKVTWMALQTARLGSLAGNTNAFFDPELIPESTKIFWLILAGDIYYIDACTGEYLGSNTSDQFNDIRKKPSTSP